MARTIDRIVVHCSDTPDNRDIGVDEIRRWHMARGWTDVGYHAVIRRDGTIEAGRHDNDMGAHVRGHNAHSLGVCVVGRGDFDHRQIIALFKVLRGWMRRYAVPPERVQGHYELDDNKTCPNIRMDKIREAL